MGLMDMVSQMAGGGSQNGQVAGGLMQELQSSPGGMGGLLQMFHQNGMGGQVQQWAGGQTAPADPNQIEQGMAGSGIIDRISQRTGVPPMAVKAGLAAAVPLMIHHLVSYGHVDGQGQSTGAQPESGGMLQSILGRMI